MYKLTAESSILTEFSRVEINIYIQCVSDKFLTVSLTVVQILYIYIYLFNYETRKGDIN